MSQHLIYVIVKDGTVEHVMDVPAGIEVQVLNYDVEPLPDGVEPSPLDGEACQITSYSGGPS